MSVPRLNLIVAACNNNGIGKNGSLPWNFRKDMDFFKKMTTDTKDPDKKNAVIMGRKTWFSIPEKFRPLKGRVNVVLSRELKEVSEGVYISRSLPEALDLLTSDSLRNQIESIHIIGGSSVYKMGVSNRRDSLGSTQHGHPKGWKSIFRTTEPHFGILFLPNTTEKLKQIYVVCLGKNTREAMNNYDCRIYLTRILADFDCDTHLPEIKETVFKKIENPPSVPTELQEEKGIKFRFEVYDKKMCDRKDESQEKQSPNFDKVVSQNKMGSPDNMVTLAKALPPENLPRDKMLTPDKMVEPDQPMKFNVQEQPMKHNFLPDHPMKFSLMAAMCHSNRGIANGLKLPWPPLREDYKYYTTMVSHPRSSKQNGKIIHIRGRVTWDCCRERERSLPNVYHIIVSQSLSDEPHPRLLKIVSSFDAAVELCNTKPLIDEIDSVWVMGGASIYKSALDHPLCDKLYLTHVYKDFPADTFFPDFENNFSEIRCEKGSSLIEENDVTYEFKVYQKI